MTPSKRVPSLTIAVPASLVSDTPHLREKTLKIGLVGRAAVIFRVDEILVYPDLPDQDQKRDSELVYTILSYLDTPQYLRKLLFPFKNSLRYAGVLSPLRTPHHPLTKRVKDLRLGDFREGVVVKFDESNSFMDIGVERPAILRGKQFPPRSRLTAKITSVHQGFPEVSLAKKEEINIYWGYGVTVSNLPMGRMVKRGSYDLVVMTSRRGRPLTEVASEVGRRWKRAHKVLVAFGSPREGLNEILERENVEINDVADLVINAIPQQGTETVRTEEAIYATLAIINILT